METTTIAILTLSAICLVDIIAPATAREQALPDHALTIYTGRVTGDHWEETLVGNVHFADAYMVAGAVSRTAKRFFDNALSLELEGQVAKYFGDQRNWELNLPIVALRWNDFPWDKYLDTGFAWGIGPSYATSEPQVEREINGSTERWLVYWFGELTFGLPDRNWALSLRLYHRSDGFDMVADEGGANTLAAGIKLHF
uniref:Lipid A 3-O-deacylase (PagL) n=1 Tax=Candidatus Kentrum sp. TUN TaxID=2126343 RepID=A0A450ZAV7_9GAMM|nr:MAG: hypothetical protein BECKTUN1418D_GA0071000_100329 [Candidatus Kentron sp. TUN]